jgi:peroxiredoxin (alkyl hydroperoxide reductase subunit C)
MIHPDAAETVTVRTVYFVDPNQNIRAIIYYPLSTGRNFDELKRLVIALQTADALEVATPADWRPGEPVIVPPPGSCGTAKERMDGHDDTVTCVDWFFCTKEVDEKQVYDAIRA